MIGCWGTRDTIAAEVMADRIKARRPQTNRYKMTECGHWPPLEVPERIAKAIRDRLDYA
jgi:pimeloyl-ACP methyl ester carboxylesterase